MVLQDIRCIHTVAHSCNSVYSHWCVASRCCVSVLIRTDLWVFSSCQLLGIRVAPACCTRVLVNVCYCFLSGFHWGIQLMGHKIWACSDLSDTNGFPKWLHQFILLPAMYGSSGCSEQSQKLGNICVFHFSHPGSCVVYSCYDVNSHFPAD